MNAAPDTSAILEARIAPASYRAPTRRVGIVGRDDIVNELMGVGSEQLVVVSGPAGYGKTITAILWDESDERDFAWVHLDQADNDPDHVLRHIALAIDSLQPLHDRTVRALTAAGRTPLLDMVPALLEELGRREGFVLVLDDTHLVTAQVALQCLDGLVEDRPDTCQITLIGRTPPLVHLGRQMMSDLVLLLTETQLAMDKSETARLLGWMGVELEEDELEDLLRYTEGWPGGLHLIGLALAGRWRGAYGVLRSRTRELVVDYIVEDVLTDLPVEVADFVKRSAVLERMSPSLLDELLEQEDSAAQLDGIERSGNLFLIPFDDDERSYRYHNLFGDVLRDRLQRDDPELSRSLHQRASLLLERRGDVDGAIRHALTAEDVRRAADLIFARVLELVNGGRVGQLREWLELLGPDSIDDSVTAALAWGWYGEVTGDIDLLKRAVAAAEQSTENGPLADGSPSVGAAVAILRALQGWNGLDGVISDAQVARDAGDPPGNPWWVVATVLQGTAFSMIGTIGRARQRFLDALRVMYETPALEAVVLAHLALISVYDEDLPEADRFASQARHLMERHNLFGILPTISVYPTIALVAARCARPDEARRAIAAGRVMVARLDYLSPRTALLASLSMARAALAIGDFATASELAEEAERAQRSEPSAPLLNEQLHEVQAQLASGDDGRPATGAPPLSEAELRVLRHLPSHLSLQEIADKLVISRNTAKSHVASIYRKLGVSSRSDAVSQARQRGMRYPRVAEGGLSAAPVSARDGDADGC